MAMSAEDNPGARAGSGTAGLPGTAGQRRLARGPLAVRKHFARRPASMNGSAGCGSGEDVSSPECLTGQSSVISVLCVGTFFRRSELPEPEARAVAPPDPVMVRPGMAAGSRDPSSIAKASGSGIDPPGPSRARIACAFLNPGHARPKSRRHPETVAHERDRIR